MPEEATTEPQLKLYEIEERLTCANGHSFIGKTAQLIPFISTNISLGDVIHVGLEDFHLYIGGGGPNTTHRGYLVSCPECGLVHLTGFAPAELAAQLAAGVDNTPPERQLTT